MTEARRIVLVAQGDGDSRLATALGAAASAPVTLVAVGDLVAGDQAPDGELFVVEAAGGAASVWAAVGALRRCGNLRPVVAWLPSRDAELAVEVMRAGADDCLFGEDLDRLQAFLDRAGGAARAAPGADHDEMALAHTLIEASPHGFQLSDLDGVITFSNGAHHRILEYSVGHLVGRTVWELGADEATAAASRAEYERIVRELPAPTPYLTRSLTASGRVVDLLINWDYLRDQRHAVLGLCSVITDVTDLETTRIELRDTTERYRLLFERSPVAKWELDLTVLRQSLAAAAVDVDPADPGLRATLVDALGRTVVRAVNQAATAVLERCRRGVEEATPEARAGWPWYVDGVVDGVVAMWRGGAGAVEFEASRSGDVGSELHVLAAMSVLPGAHDSWRNVILTMVDITDRKQAEEALRDSEYRFRLLVESSPLAIIVHRERRIVYANRRTFELAGVTSDDALVGHPLEAFVHPDDIGALRRFMAEEGEESLAPGREVRMLRPDGRIVDLSARTMPISYAAGRARMVLCHDITEEKRTRLLLARRDAILEAVGFAAQRLLRPGRWMDSLPAILARLGTAAQVDSVVVRAVADGDASPPCSSVVGAWTSAGSSPSGDSDAAPDWAAPAFARWRAELERGEVVAGTVRQLPEPERSALEQAGLTSVVAVPVFVAGQWWGAMQYHQCRNLRVWEAPEIDALGVAASALGGAIERQRAEETEALHRKQIMQADRLASLGILVSGVAHEVNNPNQFILSNAELLHRVVTGLQPVADEYYREHGDFLLAGINYSELRSRMVALCDHVAEGSRRIGSIVEALRDFAQDRSTRLDEVVDLNRVVKSALVLVGSMAARARVELAVDLGAELPAVHGSFHQLEQVVVNLVQNACQAVEARGGAITVRTRHLAATGQAEVAVCDDGCGIPAEHLHHVTDPFFTTRRERGGTGLGLAVTSGIVRDHGGRLDFSSEVGVGTTVTVTLPVAGRPVAVG